MLFKVGDVLEYRNGYSAIISNINDEFINLEISNGEKYVVYRGELISAIASGTIKFKTSSINVKPSLFIKKHKI